MDRGLTIEREGALRRSNGGRRAPRPEAPADVPAMTPAGKVPRIARIMGLAIKMDMLLRDGVVKDYAELARLGHVSRARVTQIMNLLHLAPDIQEEILFLPPSQGRWDAVRETNVRPIAAVIDWRKQRGMWRELAQREH